MFLHHMSASGCLNLIQHSTTRIIILLLKRQEDRVSECPVGIRRACLATTVLFRSPIQMTFFLPFQSGEKVIFTAETVAQRNGIVIAKQALNNP